MASKPAERKSRRHKRTIPASQVNRTASGAKKRGGKPQPQKPSATAPEAAPQTVSEPT